VQEIVIPRLGWSMEVGTFVGWLKKDGDFVKRGEALFELEGEKATQEIEAVDEGILRIPVTGPKQGTVHKVGTIIGFLVGPNESFDQLAGSHLHPAKLESNFSDSLLASPSVRRLARKVGVQLSQIKGTGPRGRILHEDVELSKQGLSSSDSTLDSPSVGESTKKRSLVSTPRARRLAAELGIDWRQLRGSGFAGRVRECDIRAGSAQFNQPASDSKKILISRKRRLIAQRLMESQKQTVPVTLTARVDATNLVNFRERFKIINQISPIPSYQDIITKIVSEVLKSNILLAGRWQEDHINLPSHDELHIGIAVDTEDGLLVPVIRDVAGLTIESIAVRSNELVKQARSGKITVAQMQGGVFTITNLGALGIDFFTPVINYPETSILGLGAIRKEVVVIEDDRFAARFQMSLSLTFDHRVLDGAPAARFLKDLVSAIAGFNLSDLK
jgi:pyruvate dehydrogenase E2 component (dihydrolipoamide acetyltransferase)